MKKYLFCVLIFIFAFTSTFAFYDAEDSEIVEYEDVLETSANIQDVPVINSTSAILYDRTSKRILYGKDIYRELPNASTTKILTAIVAYENGNLNDVVTISKNAINVGGSKIKFRVGDKISLNDLLIGLLMRSGNDSAIAIAEHIGGNVEDFCEMMNEKAFELGAKNTHFTSPHGLDDEEHYSCAYDLAIIADYALNIPVIANIVSKKTASIKINDYYKELANTNEMLSYYPGADGVKTGYTGDAGRCLVTSATKDNWQLISVVLGCSTKKQRTIESTQLLNYGFQNYELIDVFELIPQEVKIHIDKSKRGNYYIPVSGKYLYPMKKDEIIIAQFTPKDGLIAPIRANSQIGIIKIKNGKNIICEIQVLITENVDRKEVMDYCLQIVKEICYFFESSEI